MPEAGDLEAAGLAAEAVHGMATKPFDKQKSRVMSEMRKQNAHSGQSREPYLDRPGMLLA